MRREWLFAASLLVIVGVGCQKKTTPPVNTGPERSQPIGDMVPQDTAPLDGGVTTDVSPLPPGGAQPMPAIGGQTYVVQRGDTLMQIARKFYNGDASQWRKIQAANNLQDANQIKAGQKLVIP